MAKTKKPITVLDATVNATRRMAKDKGVDINFYDNEWAKYFAPFVRRVYGKKNLNDEECMALLNDDFIRNVQGGLLKNFSKDRNLSHAYLIYKNAVASVETALAKEYGELMYYDLEISKNPEARETFKKFEEWQDKKDKEFEQLAEVSDAVYSIQHSKNPMKELSQNGLVITPLIGAGIAAGVSLAGCISSDQVYRKINRKKHPTLKLASDIGTWISLGALVFSPIITYIALDYIKEADQKAMDSELEKLADHYGFNSGTDLVNYINQATYQYMTPEEAQAMHTYLIDMTREGTATQYGFENLADALAAIESAKAEKTIYRDDALNDLSIERQHAFQDLAHENALIDYDDLIKYLNNHKILEGEYIDMSYGGAGWSVFNYDTPVARAIAAKVDYIDKYYTDKTTEINSQIWPQTVEVITDENLKNLARELNANEVAINATYENLIIDDANVFYSPNTTIQAMGNDVLDVVNKYGKDEITTEAPKKQFVIGSKAKEIEVDTPEMDTPDLPNEMADALGDAAQAIEIDPLDIASGVGVGAGISVAAKNSKLIKDMIKIRKIKKMQAQNNEVATQMQQDLERKR